MLRAGFSGRVGLCLAAVTHAVSAAARPPYPIPTAKLVIQPMDAAISTHVAVFNWTGWRAAQEPFWTPDLVYDTVHGLGNHTGLRGFYEGEHVPWNRAFDDVSFNQLLFLGEESSATTTTYALARWRGAFLGQPPSGDRVRVRICDFYRLRGRRIAYNWMMLDVPDLLRQAGRRVVPAAALRDDGWFQPPAATDGSPSPYSPLTPPDAADASREVVLALLDQDWYERSATRSANAAPLWAEDLRFYGPSGLGFATSLAEYSTHILGSIRRGLRDRRFVLDVLACEGAYCGAHGYLHGTHSGCFLGEHATGKAVRLRLGLHWHVVDGRATEGYMMMDHAAFFAQLGVDVLGRTTAPPACPHTEKAAGQEHPTTLMQPWSNACLSATDLQPPTKDAPATFLAECPRWVAATTDAVWRPDLDAASVNASLREYFYEGWTSVSSFGQKFQGMNALMDLVWTTKRAFPDLKIHITDSFCVGNDVDGYKTTMPDVLVGTHTGWHPVYGAPTGRRFAFGGIAVTYVQKVRGRWQYIAEWIQHDERALLAQLGVSPPSPPNTTAAAHDCHTNSPTWGWRPETATAETTNHVGLQLAAAVQLDHLSWVASVAVVGSAIGACFACVALALRPPLGAAVRASPAPARQPLLESA